MNSKFFQKQSACRVLRGCFACSLVTVLKYDFSFSLSRITCKCALKILTSLSDCSLYKVFTGKDLGFYIVLLKQVQ